MAALGKARSALGVVSGALRAEFVKLALIVGLLWLVLETYEEVVVLAFFGTFFATVVIFAMAFFVREY